MADYQLLIVLTTLLGPSIMQTENNRCNNKSGYKLKCLSCDQICIGQTGRDLTPRYRKHFRDIKCNK